MSNIHTHNRREQQTHTHNRHEQQTHTHNRREQQTHTHTAGRAYHDLLVAIYPLANRPSLFGQAG